MKLQVITIALMATSLTACSTEPPQSSENELTEAANTSDEKVTEATDDVTVPVFTGPSGSEAIGINGYDAVSYFTGEGTPVQGSSEHRVRYNGVEYHFSSEENAAIFLAEPAKYAPQYGGHCAWAASKGKLAPGDPKLAKVVDGKLYLNFNDTVQKDWLSDIPGYIEKADKEFPKISPNARFDDA